MSSARSVSWYKSYIHWTRVLLSGSFSAFHINRWSLVVVSFTENIHLSKGNVIRCFCNLSFQSPNLAYELLNLSYRTFFGIVLCDPLKTYRHSMRLQWKLAEYCYRSLCNCRDILLRICKPLVNFILSMKVKWKFKYFLTATFEVYKVALSVSWWRFLLSMILLSDSWEAIFLLATHRLVGLAILLYLYQ